MAFIDVDHKTLRNIADAIDEYCNKQDTGMKAADIVVKHMLSTAYVSKDAMEFKKSWEKIDDDDSTTKQFKESLENYANCLRVCADEYQKAQEDSYNQAYKLWR